MVNPFKREADHMVVETAGPVNHEVRVPGSKSLTNRFLLLAAMARGTSRLTGVLSSEDTHYMRNALDLLGVSIQEEGDSWTLSSRSWRSPDQPLFVGNAGTAMRFLAPALALMDSQTELTGNERMQARPIADLVAGLRQLGCQVNYEGKPGYPPLKIRGPMSAGRVRVRGDASSQYLSGLLMALPRLKGDSRIEVEGPLVSQTYVAMTLDCMARFGVRVAHDPDFRTFQVPGPQEYAPSQVQIEPDGSTASYWFALPMMTGGSVCVLDVPETSQQGDYGLLDILVEMGARVTRSPQRTRITQAVLQGIEVDMNTMSDVAPTLAVIATRAEGPVTIRNVANMRIKECDRIDCLQTAFDSLGLDMESGRDWMRINPGRPTKTATLDPRDDHRMAMVFGLLGLAYGGVTVAQADCVAKTYPAFWQEMAKAFA